MRTLVLTVIALAECAAIVAMAPSAWEGPALAAERFAPSLTSEAAALERVDPEPRGRPVVATVTTPAPAEAAAVSANAPAIPTAAPVISTVAAVIPTPVRAAAPVVRSAPPSPVPAVVPQAATTAVAAPPSCAATHFCYPRLGIAGPIVPYDDCSGTTEVGPGIRQLSCVRSGIWLAGHAYTQFGRITGFTVGDVVIVRGSKFEITASSVQRSCEPTTQAVAPLSLQTSLDSAACGRVLVVQGRPAP